MKTLQTTLFKINSIKTITIKNTLFFLFALLMLSSPVMAQQNADPSAALEVNSTTKGFLPPRMTTLQRDNIASPATGLTIFNTDTNSLNYFNGTAWTAITKDSVVAIADTDGDTKINTEEAANEDIIRFDVAGTEAMVIDADGDVGIGTAPNSTASLDISSTTKGFLPPRMTITERDAITTPAAGLIIYNTSTNKLNLYIDTWVELTSGEADTVLSASGQIWKSKNLGADRIATSSTDAASYGYLYQWGRNSDGHQFRISPIVAGPVASGSEGSDFITSASADWLSSPDNTRWNGATKGTHDPCPSGFRVPTETELESERTLFSPDNAAGAYASVLKFSIAGYRDRSNGALNTVGTSGNYWSSTLIGTNARFLSFNVINSRISSGGERAFGLSVRCIKE